ncbi:MAG: hypothetical protein ACUVV0_00740 [Anaerolineae bacterium]
MSDREKELIRSLWERDPSLWKEEPEHRKVIANRLGWLDAPDVMSQRLGEFSSLAAEVKEAGFTNAVLLGMGGSSLCPEVCSLTFGSAPGHPPLTVLDTTDPASILNVEKNLDLAKTLFIVSSKSGDTIETLSLYEYFFARMQEEKGGRAGENLLAITDPEVPLAKIAGEKGFRRLFLNPPDIGGRYSALSYFGLVPAAVIGMDVKTLLVRAQEMARRCRPEIPTEENPGLRLGISLAENAAQGRDKITIICSPPIASFGTWLEQLMAESTGKEGKGLVPIEGEPLGSPAVYDKDRLFIYLHLDYLTPVNAWHLKAEDKLCALEEAGHPVVELCLEDPYDLGGEFFRWEVATAAAGAILGVNPFDEPNVRESKENTARLLKEFAAKGCLPEEEPLLEEGGLSLYGDPGMFEAARKSLPDCLKAFFSLARPGDYLALMAYLERSAETHSKLSDIRLILRDTFRLASTLGYGPRFLHSTGQLHKGGPEVGLFIQITSEDAQDVPIPGKPYGFSTLKAAQAMGDFRALQRRGRRVIRLHLAEAGGGLQKLATLCTSLEMGR